jgi:hypothetical protein
MENPNDIDPLGNINPSEAFIRLWRDLKETHKYLLR